MSTLNGRSGGSRMMLAHVYIQTLGNFEVQVNGKPAIWKHRTAGARQLQLMVMYLVARRDIPVPKDDLRAIARRRSEHPPQYVIPALIQLLESWELAGALVITERSITLRRAEAWCTDTDLLDHWCVEAARHQADGEPAETLKALERAGQLCRGTYMPTYDALPEYSIDDELDYWQQTQQHALIDLAWKHLELTRPHPCAAALRAAARAVRIDPWHVPTRQAAADIARHCGNERRARSYEQRDRDE